MQQSELLVAHQIPSIVQHHTTSPVSVNIKLYTDHVMLYNLDPAEYIDQCVPVSSTIRILIDMSMHVFVGVLTWKSLFANSIERQIVNSKPTISTRFGQYIILSGSNYLV